MGLRQRQSEFAQAAAALIIKAHELGYDVTLGDAYRDARVHGDFGVKEGYGRASSVHKLRMAIDLNLFMDGEYLGTTEAHAELGKWWEKEYKHLGSRWGGRFNDGNHYSFEVWGSA